MVVIEWLGISDGAAYLVGAGALLVTGVLALWHSDWDNDDNETGAEA